MSEDKTSNESAKNPNYSTIYRSEMNRILGGVCGGLGEYFKIDPTIIRIVFILLTVFGGSGLLIYLILWLILPSENKSNFNREDIKTNFNEVKEKANQFAQDLRNSTKESRIQESQQRSWLAFIVILVGVILLLNNYGFGELINISKLWPLILIVLGVSIVMRKQKE